MRRFRLASITVAACLLLSLALPAFAQQEPATRIPGYLDTHTGNFMAATPELQPDPDATTAVTHSGKITFKFTVTVASTIPTTAAILCHVQLLFGDNVVNYVAQNNLYETATAVATRSGSTATCSVLVPYSWKLVTASADSIGLTYTVSATTPSNIAVPFVYRYVSSTASMPVPNGTGTVTTKTITATI